MAYRKIEHAMRKGRRRAEEQFKAGVRITPELVERAAAQASQHRGQQYLFMTSAMEVVLEKGGTSYSQLKPQR